jgi:predicted Zn-dependent peptidase
MKHTLIQQQLDNGITLITIPLASTEAVTCIVLIGVGSRHESEHQRGLAHFTEHLVFKGGKKYPNSQIITQTLDSVGGEFNAFTSYEFTGFYTKTAAKHMELGLDVLSDMTLHATFPETELEKEKGVIIEEINMYDDIPMRRVDHLLSDLVYGDTPLGRPILGTKKSVNSYTRDDFMKYREQFYMGEECTVVVAGALEHSAVVEMVSRAFAELPKGKPYAPIAARFATGDRVKVDTRPSEQTHLMLAVQAYEVSHPKRAAYRVLATILGGNMSSRLFTRVREEQGLCYYVRAYPEMYLDTGILTASAGVDNARLHKAIKAILKEMKDLSDTLVSPEELERAKQFMISKMLLSLEDSEQVAEFYGMQHVLERKIESPELIEKETEAVTAEEVQAVARELFTDERLRLAVVGPDHTVAELEALLTLG